MTSFPLKIVTPDGLVFDGQAEMVKVRTLEGDMAVMARHINCVVPLGMGTAAITTNGERKIAACIGGMLSVSGGKVMLIPTTFEWQENIDVERAVSSENRAMQIIKDNNSTKTDILLARARLKRALVRQRAAEYK